MKVRYSRLNVGKKRGERESKRVGNRQKDRKRESGNVEGKI